jgi:uncharacterized membrane protein YfcA
MTVLAITAADDTWGLLALVAAALLVGAAKTAVGGLGTIAVALFASVMPARESTAALLLVLLVGDLVAVTAYGRHCDWRLLAHLVPGVVPGLALGSLALAVASDTGVRVGIGVVLLLLVGLQLGLRRRARLKPGTASPEPWSWQARAATGAGAGFATMVANAAGPVMTLYLAGQGVTMRRFLGTSAWFFLIVNLAKLPFSWSLGLLDRSQLLQALVLAPLVLLGGLVGALWVRRLRQETFEVVVLGATVVSAAALLLP